MSDERNRLPDWVKSFVILWRDRLYLHQWTFRLTQELCVDGDEHVMASMSSTPAYNDAHMRIRADIEDTPEWRQIIVHEIMHTAHARIDAVVSDMIIPGLGESARPLAREAYRQVVEPFIESIADTLYELSIESETRNDGSIRPDETPDHGTGNTTRTSTDAIGTGPSLVS